MANKKGRIAVTLEGDIYNWIIDKADSEGRTPSNLAAFLLSSKVKELIIKENEDKK